MRYFRRRPLGGRSGDLLNKMNVTLMMILLAFFIVLNTMAVPAQDKRKAALGSLIGTLGILIGGPSPMTSEKKSLTRPSAPIISPQAQAAQLLGEFESYAIREKIAEKISTVVTSSGLELTLESSLLFNPGSATLNPSAHGTLMEIAIVLGKMGGPTTIEGHTSGPRTVSAQYPGPMDLSIARAGALASFFSFTGGLHREKLSIAGYGALRPAFEGDDANSQRRNDRIRIIHRWTELMGV